MNTFIFVMQAHGSEGQSVHLMSRIKVKLKALEEIGLQVQHALVRMYMQHY